MQRIILLICILMIVNLVIVLGSQDRLAAVDRRLRREVEDFEDFLRTKISNAEREKTYLRSTASEETFSKEDSSNDYYFEDEKQEEFGSLMEDLARDNPTAEENARSSRREETPPAEHRNSEKASVVREEIGKHYREEELLLVRRSDSDLYDPIPDIVETIFNGDRLKESVNDEHQQISGTEEQDAAAIDEKTEQAFRTLRPASQDETCRTEHFTSNLHKTCSDGPEYDMEFPPEFSKTLKEDLMKVIPDSKNIQCGSRRRLRQDAGVESRALCPFEWNITSRNPARIPQYLYEAKCSCTGWYKTKSQLLRCIEVKRVIPVLWIVDCENGKKKYRQGWEEISVACVPDEQRKVSTATSLDKLQ